MRSERIEGFHPLAPSSSCGSETNGENEHLVQFYEDDPFLIDSIARFIRPGIVSGHSTLLIATPEHLGAIEKDCIDDGIDLLTLRASGQFVSLDAAEQLSKFMIDGWPDESRFLAHLEPLLERISGAGSTVRAFGEMVALLWADGRRDAAVRVEALWNVLARRRHFSLLCAYPMRMFQSRAEREAFLAVLAEHSHVIPAESYSALLDPRERLRAITELQQKAAALETEATERARAEAELCVRCEELAGEHRRKDEFLAMLGHELRNPLAAIRTGLSVARLDETRREAALEIAGRQAGHLAHLVDDLLDVGRITRGQIRIEKRPAAIAEIIERAIEVSRTEIEGRRHDLTVALPSSGVFVEGDPERLQQVVVNLLTNAAKYTGPGGRIDVSAECDGHRVAVRVRDNGVGMSAALRDRAFELFAQGEQPLDRSSGGLGVGLTIARHIVELHEGSIEAMSDGPGTGSEVVVRLPVLRNHSPGPAVDSPAGREPSGVRILVVEDNPDVSKSLRLLLECLGHQVRAIGDGREAIRTAHEFEPDLMLVDIGLPGIDGYEVARRLRAEPDLQRLRIFALSGYARPEDRERALAAGFDEHLEKPLRIEELRKLTTRRTA